MSNKYAQSAGSIAARARLIRGNRVNGQESVRPFRSSLCACSCRHARSDDGAAAVLHMIYALVEFMLD